MIYQDYVTPLRNYLNGKSSELSKGFSNQYNNFNGNDRVQNLSAQLSGLTPENSLEKLISYYGLVPSPLSPLGKHPDFKHLKGDMFEMHYAVSLFIDIKGSTSFYRKYSLEQIRIITKTILTASIHTCRIFGGYIHRLQGDGTFIYFGKKNQSKKDAVLKAILATSFLSYFIKYEFPSIFEENGTSQISTKIGIDFGDDSDVMWVSSGVGECSEITTNSLHTSLASKMQANARSNQIIIGQHVVDVSKMDSGFYNTITDSYGNTDNSLRYVFENGDFRYRQYLFNWEKYLKSSGLFTTDINGNLLLDEAQLGKHNNENIRLHELRKTASGLSSGALSIISSGGIVDGNSGTKSVPHRFYFDSEKDGKI